MADTDIKFIIKQSGATSTIAPGDNILKSGELAYTYVDGDSSGGDRLFIGAGGGEGFATEIHTIGGKYYTDMMDHPKGQVVPSSAIITDANNKINLLNVDNITINANEINTTSGNLTLNPTTSNVDVSTSKISNVVDPTAPQDAATKNYVDTLNVFDVGADVSLGGTGALITNEILSIKGGVNTNTTRANVSGGVEVKVNLDSDVLGLSRLTVDNIDINGETIAGTYALTLDAGVGSRVNVLKDFATTDNIYVTNGKNLWFGNLGKIYSETSQLKIDNTAGDVVLYYAGAEKLKTTNSGVNVSGDAIISGNLQVNGTTTTINSTELTVDDKNITLASGAANAAAADSAGIHVDGANADIYYDAATDTWNLNKDVKAPNIDIQGNITVSGDITITEGGSFVGGYEGFDSDFAQKTTTDLTEGTNLYYTDARFDTRLATKTTTNLTEGSNLYFTNERVDDRVYNLLRAGEGIDFLYDDASNEFDISCELASTLNAGIATFDSQDFLVTAGNVELATIDCGTF